MLLSCRQAIVLFSWVFLGLCSHAQTLRTANFPNRTTNTFVPTWTINTYRTEFRVENMQVVTGARNVIWGTHPSSYPNDYCATQSGTFLLCSHGDGAGNGAPGYTFTAGDDLRVRYQRDNSTSPPLLTMEVWKGDCSGYTKSQYRATTTVAPVTPAGVWFNSGDGGALHLAFARAYSTIDYSANCPADAPTAKADLWDFRFEGDSLIDVSTHAYTMTAPGATFANSTTYPPIAVIDGWPTFLPVGRTGVAFQLSGTHSVTSVGDGVAATYAWSKASGPGTLTFSNASAASPTVTASTAGEYVIRLTITDSAAVSSYKDQSVSFVTTDANCIVQASGEFDSIIGPVVAHGCSPWPWYDVTEAAVADTLVTPWSTPPPTTAACGTAAINYPPNVYDAGMKYTQGPSGGAVQLAITGCTPVSSAFDNKYGYFKFTDEGGATVYFYFYFNPGSVSGTTVNTGLNYLYVPPAAFTGANMEWGTFNSGALIGWLTGNYQNHWNFYEAGLGMYRLYRRTGMPKYRDAARSFCTNWWTYSLGGGYQLGQPMDAGMHFIMACAADNHPEWWDRIASQVVREANVFFPGGIAPAPVTSWPGGDTRINSYVTRFTALAARFYPDHTATPAATRATWCDYTKKQINNYWAWGTTIGGTSYYWPEDIFTSNYSYPLASIPIGSPTGVFGTSPWRSNGLASMALGYAWEALNDPSVCNDTATSDVLYKVSDASGIIPKAARFIYDYGRTPGGGVYYDVLYPSKGYLVSDSTIMNSQQSWGGVQPTNGSTALLGSNTLFTLQTVANGQMTIYAPGDIPRAVTVASVQDNTHLTLTAPYPGVTAPQPWGAYSTVSSVSVTAGSATVVGSNTLFTKFFGPCDGTTFIGIVAADLRRVYQVLSCADDTHLTMNTVWGGATSSGNIYAMSRVQSTNCAPSLATYCEPDYYDPSGRAITSDVAASSAWMYAKSGDSYWSDKAQYWMGKIFGGTPGGSGSSQGVPTGPYADGAVGSLGGVLPACGVNAPPCGDGALEAFKGKFFGMAVGAGNSPTAMANLLSGPSTTLLISVDFRLASVPNAGQVRLKLKKPDETIITVTCLASPCQIRADAGLTNPQLTLEYLTANGVMLAASEPHSIKIH